MKKAIKITLLSLLSLIGLILIIVCIALWLVFTPERLTPIVNKQADKLLTCQSELGEIELTFFSTFPDFGIRIKDFRLINPTPGAQSDTLISLNEFTGIVDIKTWWKTNDIVLVGMEMNGGAINLWADSLGNSNYNIIAPDTVPEVQVTEEESTVPRIDVKNISLKGIDITYSDQSLSMNTAIKKLDASVSGMLLPDSLSGIIAMETPSMYLEYDGEKYLQNSSVKLDLPLDFSISKVLARLKNAEATVNGMKLHLGGSVEYDTLNGNIATDLAYSLESWPIKGITALVPPSYTSYLEGIDIDGVLSSNGTVKGIMNDSLMPLMNIKLVMDKGSLKYSGFPIPLHDMAGSIDLYTDLTNDKISFVKINNFAAKTPRSSFVVEGMVKQLFSDIYCDLTTTAGITVDEFAPMIPDSMDMEVKGRVSGRVKSIFTLSQLEKMQIEKMKFSGNLRLTDFYADYDSMVIKTHLSDIDFSVPNAKPTSKATRFAYAKINMNDFTAEVPGSYAAFLKNANLTLETSDARDTTRIPDFLCSFTMDSLSAGMDSISISVSNPSGKIALSPGSFGPDQPHVLLSYSSRNLDAKAGKNSVAVGRIKIDTDILNDNKQKDIFLQWLAKGSFEMEDGNINVDGLVYPVEIPSINMNFDPQTFRIEESKFKIDKSDFQLRGNLGNILSYFRGDSILRGDFSFLSNTTDVGQLMALTNGIGQTDSTATIEKDTVAADTSYTGPYMVPKGIDIFLTTNIGKAVIGIDTATNILGSVQVHDGTLVLDGLQLKTPAAKIQLTAMYQTPRKNHLYLGLDYHMLDIEIDRLLAMIPDIDTIMPMLRSFKGKAEFHIAVETYLDSLYNVKKSTIRGASSIKGNNLVLMDGETFGEIAKTLKFSKHAENKVDSLSAEFTIFRNEIDIYPFLIVMDRYKAVISGRHNLDMSYDYHISVVDCPVPIKLGVDVKGTEAAMHYSLAKCRYAEFYRPSSRKVVENKQIELRKLIRDALTKKVSG
jgi:hypothetical protein